MSVTAPAGFVAAGVACGVKASGALDLALVATDDARPVPAAGVFTRNRMTAAPVLVSRHHLDATGGHAAAVVLNSGNANAATGAPGHADAEAMADAVAAALGTAREAVLVCSTGLIGIPLPVQHIVDASPALVAAAAGDAAAAHTAAEAIRTTDTFAKEVTVAGDGCTVGAMAKGAAMLAPNMATMLAVVTTDAVATPEVLGDVLRTAVDASFNVMTTDGCTSTNDTVLLLASGRAGEVRVDALRRAVTEACRSLAQMMVADAEGATKSVHLEVVGAADDDEAARGARKVADSNLCKCSWYGCDPYWGRVASELGSAGIAFDQTRISVSYGGHVVAAGGVEIDHDRAAVAAHMAQRDLHVVADLGLGSGRAELFTNDLTHAYVDENMGTS
ncbi:MAG: bifunctional glutamate N-acetyltransferase/amino-acid acetyltransferase ArgJ [Acidimicrobiales bacterium]|nr:bifunctional glutamate N-acetyltransferase/amino-acid acetyltransferase ArgJ [Acidimicrobiales bacterium]